MNDRMSHEWIVEERKMTVGCCSRDDAFRIYLAAISWETIPLISQYVHTTCIFKKNIFSPLNTYASYVICWLFLQNTYRMLWTHVEKSSVSYKYNLVNERSW